MAFNPAGRVIEFIPIPGKFGYITINGFNINLSKWEPQIKGEPLDVTNFNSPTSAQGYFFKEWELGNIDGSFVLSGPRDQGGVSWNPMPGETGIAVLGYSALLSFQINFLVTDVGGGQDAKGMGEFNVTVKANGYITNNRPVA